MSVGGRDLNNMWYADDTTLVADSDSKRLQRLLTLHVVAHESISRKLQENIKNTFCLAIFDCSVFIDGEEM